MSLSKKTIQKCFEDHCLLRAGFPFIIVLQLSIRLGATTPAILRSETAARALKGQLMVQFSRMVALEEPASSEVQMLQQCCRIIMHASWGLRICFADAESAAHNWHSGGARLSPVCNFCGWTAELEKYPAPSARSSCAVAAR